MADNPRPPRSGGSGRPSSSGRPTGGPRSPKRGDGPAKRGASGRPAAGGPRPQRRDGTPDREPRREGRHPEPREERGPRRPPLETPELAEDVTPGELDPVVRRQLKTLPMGLADLVARHLVAADRALEDDPDLAYLVEGTGEFRDYIEAMLWAQDYALMNREMMMDAVLLQLEAFIGYVAPPTRRINCHHNFTEMEHHHGRDVWLTRKGAIRAGKGDLGIIPGSMGASSFIVRGLGNPESFQSASHGAGRRMSRSEAKRRFTVEDLVEQTAGIESRKDAGVLDELPAAYKDIDQVMADQSDLVAVEHSLHQILNYKGTN